MDAFEKNELVAVNDRILLSIPERITTSELIELLPDDEVRISHIQKSHKIPEFYEVRSVML